MQDEYISTEHLLLAIVDEKDGQAGKQLRTFQGHTDTVQSVALSRDGKHVLTGSRDKTAILWEAASGMQLQIFGNSRATRGTASASPIK